MCVNNLNINLFVILLIPPQVRVMPEPTSELYGTSGSVVSGDGNDGIMLVL